MSRLKHYLIVFISILYYNANAAEGCVLNSFVYATRAPTVLDVSILGSNKVFSNVGTASNNCNTGAAVGTCSVCLQGGTVVSINVAGLPVIFCNKGFLDNYAPTPGAYYTNYILQCNLDDYSWALGASAAALGLIVIRKGKFF